MSNNKKKLSLIKTFTFAVLLFVIVLLLFMLFHLKVKAAPKVTDEFESTEKIRYTNSDTHYEVLMEDKANLLNPQEEALLAESMEKITAYGNVVFSTTSDNQTSAADYASFVYSMYYGRQSGTIFLIDMDNREIYIFSNGYVSTVITQSYANVITDNIYSNATKGEYFQCAAKAFEQIFKLLSGYKIAQPMKYISNALLAVIIAMIALFGWVRLVAVPKKPAKDEQFKAIIKNCEISNARAEFTGSTKRIIQSSGSGGGYGGSGGGGGGGGGCGGGHSF